MDSWITPDSRKFQPKNAPPDNKIEVVSEKKAARSVGDMDLDLDDMVIQQREFDNAGSLYLPEKLNLINLEQFIKEFNDMDDDDVRAAIISNAVTRS